MSLADPNDDYSELVPEGADKVKNAFNKTKLYLIVLLVGILIGAYLQYSFINPLMGASQDSPCQDCIQIRTLLNKENTCLYSLLPDAKAASKQCKLINQTPAPINDINFDLNQEKGI
jgi:hypothetical protein